MKFNSLIPGSRHCKEDIRECTKINQDLLENQKIIKLLSLSLRMQFQTQQLYKKTNSW